MTGSIRTLRVEKGFGFIKDDAGKEYFFHRSAVYGEGLENLKRATAWNSTLAQGRRVRGPRTSGAQRPNGN
jgi:cold shock CspA family protein